MYISEPPGRLRWPLFLKTIRRMANAPAHKPPTSAKISAQVRSRILIFVTADAWAVEAGERKRGVEGGLVGGEPAGDGGHARASTLVSEPAGLAARLLTLLAWQSGPGLLWDQQGESK